MNFSTNFYNLRLFQLFILVACISIRDTSSSVMDEVMDVFNHWDGSYIARPPRTTVINSIDFDVAPTCDCSNCPSNSGGSGWISSGALKNCKASCDVAYQGDCLCTKDYHPTGCTLQNCTQDDSSLPANSYACYCTLEFEPAGCVSHSNLNNFNCTSGVGYQNGCQCNQVFHPNGCSISLCGRNQNSGGGFICVCGTACDHRLHGCVKELK